jgi:hypothetical protein
MHYLNINAELSKKLGHYKFGPNYLEFEDDEKLKEAFSDGKFKELVKGIFCFPVKKQIPDAIRDLITESKEQTELLQNETKQVLSDIDMVYFKVCIYIYI